MEIPFSPTHALSLVFLFLATQVSAQQSFACATRPTSSCDAYVAYVAQSPDFSDLKSVSELFGVSSSLITEASNLASEDAELVPGQLLLVPLPCRCNGSRFFANVSYVVKPSDSYYFVSVHSLENLSDWHIAVDANPAFKPSSLHPGDRLVFPLFCGCSRFENRIRFLITYVWQKDDDVGRVAAKFNASVNDVVSENEHRNFTAAVGSPVLIPVAQLPALSQPFRGREIGLKRRWIVIAAVSSSGVLVIVVLAILLVVALGLCQRRKSSSKMLGEAEDFEVEGKQGKLLRGVSGYLGKPVVYDIRTIMEATMDLSEMCKIGGSVYKAMIDGKCLAVKKVDEDFGEELKILQKVNHANLVSLFGMSLDSSGACFFVFEFAENGSLDTWLRLAPAGSGATTLGWGQRLRVALDVAHGLQYMHEHAQPSLAHRAIRARNILLDVSFKAKISGFSRAGPAEAPSVLKADVFGFGVLLLELLSGRQVEPGEALEGWERERVGDCIDPKLEGFCPIEGVLSLTALARACVQERELLRPTMGEIVFSLSLLTQSFSDALEAEELVQISSTIKAR